MYDDLNTCVTSVHSYYGLGTADLRCNLVVDRAISNNLVCEWVRNVDYVKWDEISMSSKRILEIINMVHVQLSPEESVRYMVKYILPEGKAPCICFVVAKEPVRKR